jgi:hypothetical protein
MAFPKLTRLARRTLISTAACLAAFAGPMAQQDEKTARISFDVASVKLSDSESSDRCAPNASVGQAFMVRNCALGALVLFAYDVLQQQVSGQTSRLGEKYDVTAKAEHPVI